MGQTDSAWVNDVLGASAHDWTPVAVRAVARILYVPVLSDTEVARRCKAVLSDAEQERAEHFVTEKEAALFVQRRAFRRYCGSLALGSAPPLSRITFEETEKGRAYLPDRPDLWFSFSSCRLGFLGGWSSTHAVGVDLEDDTRAVETVELARRFFSQAEAKAVEGVDGPERQRRFFQLWTLKEAALKSLGEGLPFGLDAFDFELSPTLRVSGAPRAYGGPEKFEAHVIGRGDCCAALVIRENDSMT